MEQFTIIKTKIYSERHLIADASQLRFPMASSYLCRANSHKTRGMAPSHSWLG